MLSEPESSRHPFNFCIQHRIGLDGNMEIKVDEWKRQPRLNKLQSVCRILACLAKLPIQESRTLKGIG